MIIIIVESFFFVWFITFYCRLSQSNTFSNADRWVAGTSYYSNQLIIISVHITFLGFFFFLKKQKKKLRNEGGVEFSAKTFRYTKYIWFIIIAGFSKVLGKLFNVGILNMCAWRILSQNVANWCIKLKTKMVIVAGYGHGDTSSNPGRDWLH